MSDSHTFNDFGDLTPEDMSRLASQLMERLRLQNEVPMQPGDAVGFSEEFFDASYTLGVRYYANQQFDKAHELFKLLCTLQPLNARNFKAWGANYLGRKDYASAIRAYEAAYLMSATDADTSFYLGQAHYFQKDHEEAIGHLRFAREMARRNPAAWPQIELWSSQLIERIEAKQRSS
ncbi:MAG: hypothetical protein EBR46_05470 [Betaproteobacteria bacterium]|nr:hypothetical protein [Betaproteobacteria bacterium]